MDTAGRHPRGIAAAPDRFQHDDLARAINERIHPLAQAFYAPPFLGMHNRMKEALALLCRLPPAVVRPPLVKKDSPSLRREVDGMIKDQFGKAARLVTEDLEAHREPSDRIEARLAAGGFTAEQVLDDWFPPPPG